MPFDPTKPHIHYVGDGNTGADHGQVNCHTHGFDQEFQIVLPLEPQLCASAFQQLQTTARERGRPWAADEEYRPTPHLKMRFVAATESGRAVLRIVFCDPMGLMPEDPGCDPAYVIQANDLTTAWCDVPGDH